MEEADRILFTEEADRILFTLGYYADDETKRIQIQSYIDEANEFMINAGVAKSKIVSASASSIRTMWAEARDRENEIDLTGRHKIILSILEQLRSA